MSDVAEDDLEQVMTEFFLRAPPPRQFPAPKFEIQVEQRTLGTKRETFPLATKVGDDDQRVLGPPAPEAPEWNGDGDHGHDNIIVRWFDVNDPASPDPVVFNLYRRLTAVGGPFIFWASELTTLSFHDYLLQPDTRYDYRVAAVGIGGEGPRSATLTVKTDPLPSPPPPVNQADALEITGPTPIAGSTVYTYQIRAILAGVTSTGFNGFLGFEVQMPGSFFQLISVRINGQTMNTSQLAYVNLSAGIGTFTVQVIPRTFGQTITFNLHTQWDQPSFSSGDKLVTVNT